MPIEKVYAHSWRSVPWPAGRVPIQGIDEQFRGAVIGGVVGVASDDVAVAVVVNMLPTRSAPTHVTAVQLATAAPHHIDAIPVDIRTGDAPGAAVNDAVGAIDTGAAGADRHEQIIITVAIDDGRCLDTARATGKGVEAPGGFHRIGVEAGDFDTAVPRPESQPGIVVGVDD